MLSIPTLLKGDALTLLEHQALLQNIKPAIVFRQNAATAASLSHGLHFDSTTLSYTQLYERACKTVLLMQQSWCLKKGDRVAWIGLNHPDMFVLLFAASRLGIIIVPINWRLSSDELQYIVANCTPSVLLHDDHMANQAHCSIIANGTSPPTSSATTLVSFTAFNRALAQFSNNVIDGVKSINTDVTEKDDALIVYTSGTTGRPKGAVLAQSVLRCNAKMSQHMYALSSDDNILNVLPLFHIGGINIQPLPGLLYGATLYLHQQFKHDDAVDELTKSAITLFNTVPTILQAMLANDTWQRANALKLKSVSIGSTDVPLSLIHAVHRKSIPLVQVYGATETGPIAIYQLIEHATSHAGSIGIEGAHCSVKLVNAKNQELQTNQVGEILVKGDNVLTRYWQNPTATAQSLVNGWFHTGDLAYKDEEGFYWFKERVKHVIISGGENIYPAEIERVIECFEEVKAVSVVGIENEKWGEIPVAVVECNNAQPKAERSSIKSKILEECAVKLARFKHPKSLLFVEVLPRNAMGKIIVSDVKLIANKLNHTEDH